MCNSGVALVVLYFKVELLKVCGPLIMSVVLQLALRLHNLQKSVIVVDDCILPIINVPTPNKPRQWSKAPCHCWGICKPCQRCLAMIDNCMFYVV